MGIRLFGKSQKREFRDSAHIWILNRFFYIYECKGILQEFNSKPIVDEIIINRIEEAQDIGGPEIHYRNNKFRITYKIKYGQPSSPAEYAIPHRL